jgi:hypothetical protein
MPAFQSEKEVYEVLGSFFEKAAKDEKMGPAIRDSGLVIQFEYADPASVITIDATTMPADGGYFSVIAGDTDKKPDVHMTMKADVANKFWLGKVNLVAALSRRQIVAKGPIPKILKLLPAIQPAYSMYKAYLQEIDRADLLA